MFALKGDERRSEEVRARSNGDGDTHLPAAPGAGCVGRILRLSQHFQRAPGMRAKGNPRRSEHNSASLSLEQWGAHFCFEGL